MEENGTLAAVAPPDGTTGSAGPPALHHTGRDALLVLVGYVIVVLSLLGPISIFLPWTLVEMGIVDGLALAALCVFVIRLRHGPEGVTAMVRRPERPGRALAIAVGLGVAWAVVSTAGAFVWEVLVGPLPVVQEWIDDELSTGGLVTVLSAVMIVVVAPVSEELSFRGVLFGGLRHRGFWPAALVSSALFAALHVDATLEGSLLLIGLVFPVGLIAAAIYDRLGLRAAIAFHAANNGLALLSWSLGW